jgi:ATP-binding cassette subfamily C exporter for protease/lipase
MSVLTEKTDAASALREAMGTLRPKMWGAMAFGVVAGLLHLVPTFYMFEVYGRVVNSRSVETLVMLSLVVVVALALMEALQWVRAGVMHEAGDQFEQKMLPPVYQAMFRLNLQRAGTATSQPLTDLRTLKDFFSSPLLGAVAEVPVAVLFLLLLFAFSWVLGTVALFSLSLQVVLAWANERQTQPGLAKANQLAAASQNQTLTMMRHAEVVKAMGMREAIYKAWSAVQQQMLSAQAGASDSAGVTQALTKFLQIATGSAMLGVAAWLLLDNVLPGGAAMLIVGSVLAGRILAPLGQAVSQWRAVVNAREAWKRLNNLLQQVSLPEQGMELPAPVGRLVAEGVVVIPRVARCRC